MENQVKNEKSSSKLVCNIAAVINEIQQREIIEAVKRALENLKH